MAKRRKPEQVGHLKANIAYVEIDDPGYQAEHHGAKGNNKYARAALNINENIAAHWFAKSIIANPEYESAGRFRAMYELAGGKGASSIDLSVDRVDGGAMADPICVLQLEALQQLKEIYNLLGPEGYYRVEQLCGQCLRLDNLAPGRIERDKVSKLCQNMLRHMSVHWGYRSRPIKSHQRYA